MSALPFRLGYLTHLDGVEDPEDLYDYTLEIAALAESLGYDSLWVSERHFHSGFAGLSDALTFLSAAAVRTTRIRLGTAIIPAPLRHTVEIAERASIVDALSRGRLELGIGLGNPGSSFQVFGSDTADRRSDTDETETRLHSLLAGEALDERGSTVFPSRPGLRERIWRGTQDSGSTIFTAQRGDGLLLPRARYGAPDEIDVWQEKIARSYIEHYAGAGQPRIGSSRTVFPARDRATALDELALGTERWNNQHRPGVDVEIAPRSLEEMLADDHIGYGSVDDLVGWLEADRSLPFVTDLILGFQPAITTFEQEAAKIATIATEIAPRLGWRPATRTDVVARPVALPVPVR